MNDERQEKIAVNDLKIGMFVAELDRPWLESPFLLEGVLLEEQAQIDTMINLCAFVYVDQNLSIGEYHATSNISVTTKNLAPKKINASTQTLAHQPQNTPLANNPLANNPLSGKFSFFDVLKEIKQSQQNATRNAVQANNLAFNSHIQVRLKLSDSIAEENTENIVNAHPQQMLPSLFASLKNWTGKENLTKDKATLLAAHLAKKQARANKEQHPVENEMVQVYPTYEKTQVATREVFEALAHDKQIDLTNVHEAVDGMVESIERNPDALLWLAKLKQSDNDAYNHAMNVSITMMALANFMSLPKKQVKDIGMAGLLQDIGKAKIANALLLKPGKITAEDFTALKKHVDHAVDLLKVTDNIPNNVLVTVSQHHERIDGSGYPSNLSGKEISLTGQLAGLVDTYCALTTDRVYAKGVYNQQALEVIHQLRNTKFSGVLIDQLVQFLGMYPVTSLVELNTGEIGVVIEQNSVRRLLPRVLVLLNPNKSKNNFPTTINLMQSPLTPNGEAYAIVRGLPPNSYGLNPNNYYA